MYKSSNVNVTKENAGAPRLYNERVYNEGKMTKLELEKRLPPI